MRTPRNLLVLVCLTLSAAALPGPHLAGAENAQAISLQDAIEKALQHNLDLQIERYNPRIAWSQLSGAYGGYDPFFTAVGSHTFSLSGPGIDPFTNLPVPGTRTDGNNFSSSVSGLLPFGLNYNLSGNTSERYGATAGVLPFDLTVGSASINLRQPLLKNFWIDSPRLNIRLGKAQFKQSELRLRNAIMNLVTAVEIADYNLIAAREKVKVLGKAVDLATGLLTEDRNRIKAGAMMAQEEKQAEAQAAGARADLIEEQRALVIAENVFKRLLTDTFSELQPTELQPAEPLVAAMQVFDLQMSWNRGLTKRPDLLVAKLDLERLGVIMKYNRNQLFPELDLIGTYGHSTGGSEAREFHQAFDEIRMGNRPFYSYGAQLSIPLANVSARSAYRIGKMQLDQAIVSLKKLEQDIMVQIDDAIKLARASFDRIKVTREQVEDAQIALDVEQKKLDNGKSNSFEVLHLQRDLTSARLAAITALADYNDDLAQLSLSEASTLERHNIEINGR